METYVYISLQLFIAVSFVLISVVVSQYLGPKLRSNTKNKNFESGIKSLGNARHPFSVKYFVIAILFVLFDIEVIFLYPWAVNFIDLGIEALVEMVIFMSILLIGFYYIVKKKAIELE